MQQWRVMRSVNQSSFPHILPVTPSLWQSVDLLHRRDKPRGCSKWPGGAATTCLHQVGFRKEFHRSVIAVPYAGSVVANTEAARVFCTVTSSSAGSIATQDGFATSSMSPTPPGPPPPASLASCTVEHQRNTPLPDGHITLPP